MEYRLAVLCRAGGEMTEEHCAWIRVQAARLTTSGLSGFKEEMMHALDINSGKYCPLAPTSASNPDIKK